MGITDKSTEIQVAFSCQLPLLLCKYLYYLLVLLVVCIWNIGPTCWDYLLIIKIMTIGLSIVCLELDWSNLCKMMIKMIRYDGDDGGGKTKTLSSHHLLPSAYWSGLVCGDCKKSLHSSLLWRELVLWNLT